MWNRVFGRERSVSEPDTPADGHAVGDLQVTFSDRSRLIVFERDCARDPHIDVTWRSWQREFR